jgi:PAS domain S-box-containing protein
MWSMTLSQAIAEERTSPILELIDLRLICDQIPDMIYVKDLAGRFLFANEAIVSNNGLLCLDDLVGRTDFDFLPHDMARIVADVEGQVAQSGQPHFGCEELAFLGEDQRWRMISRIPFRDKAGKIIGVLGTSSDITSQKMADRLKDAQATLLELIARGTNLSTFLEEVCKKTAYLVGGIELSFVLRPQDGERGGLIVSQSLTREQRIAVERIARADWTDLDGLLKNLEHSVAGVAPIIGEALKLLPIQSEGCVEGVMMIHSTKDLDDGPRREIISIAANLAGVASAKDRTDGRIAFLAEHDSLTGMANRLLLEKWLESSIEAANKAAHQVTVAFLDLDNFKLVNDSLGHSAGDELLKIVATRVCGLIADRGFL